MTWEEFYTSFLVRIFFVIVSGALGYFTYHQRENQKKTDASLSQMRLKQDDLAEQVKNEEIAIKELINSNLEKMYREFVSKDDYNRDINALERKMDDVKDLLMDLNRDIGVLVGKGDKG